MPVPRKKDENCSPHTEAYYEEIASQEESYLEETEQELRAILVFDDPSASQTLYREWTETLVTQTSDGPENAMFRASSVSRSYLRQSRAAY